MDYILIFMEGDRTVTEDYINKFSEKESEELIALYNQEARTGITGVHQQALYLCALHHVFRQRFGISPISVKDNLLSIGKQIDRWVPEISMEDDEPFRQEINGIEYLDDEKIKVVYSSLIIRVESINRYSGPLSSFLDAHCSFGVTNGKLLLMAEMEDPPHWLLNFAATILVPLGMKVGEDFLFAYDQLIGDESDSLCPLHHSLPECRDIPWLGSLVTREGSFLWYRGICPR